MKKIPTYSLSKYTSGITYQKFLLALRALQTYSSSQLDNTQLIFPVFVCAQTDSLPPPSLEVVLERHADAQLGRTSFTPLSSLPYTYGQAHHVVFRCAIATKWNSPFCHQDLTLLFVAHHWGFRFISIEMFYSSLLKSILHALGISKTASGTHERLSFGCSFYWVNCIRRFYRVTLYSIYISYSRRYSCKSLQQQK